MIRNQAGQYFDVLAFDENGYVNGDAAQITCKISLDDAASNPTDDTNPEPTGTNGTYRFALLTAETNADKLRFEPVSATPGVQVVGLPNNVIYTETASSGGDTVNVYNQSADYQIGTAFSKPRYLLDNDQQPFTDFSDPAFVAADFQIKKAGVYVDSDLLPTRDTGGWNKILLNFSQAESEMSEIDWRLIDVDGQWITQGGTFTGLSILGNGAQMETFLVEDTDGDPIAGAEVWINTDPLDPEADVVAGPFLSNGDGEVTFFLDLSSEIDPLDYYAWKQKSGVNFTNPTMVTVT